MGNFCSDCYAKEDNKKAELVEDPPESITTMASSIVSYSPITTIPSPIVSSSPNLKIAVPESPKIEDIWDDEDWHDALQEHDESFLLATVYDVCPEELAVLAQEVDLRLQSLDHSCDLAEIGFVRALTVSGSLYKPLHLES